MRMTTEETIAMVLGDPCASYWLKDALRSALARDPVDAANDAECLAALLKALCDEKLNANWEAVG